LTNVFARSLAPSATESAVHITPLLQLSICVVAFTLPIELPGRFRIEITTMAGSVFLLCTALQPRVCYGRVPWAVGWFGVYLYILMTALIIQGTSYPGGMYLAEVWDFVLLLSLWILVFWVCSNLFQNERLSRAVLWSLIAGCVIRALMPIVGIGRTATAQGLGGERVTALGQTPNQSAQVLALGLLALIGLCYMYPRKGWRPRYLAWGGVGLIAVALVATGSRGGLITLAVGLMVVLTSGHTMRLRVRNATVALVALGVLAIASSRSELLMRRFEAAIEERDLAGREEIYPLSVGMFLEKPLLGWGPMTNKYELASRLRSVTHYRRDAHNALLELLTASGILGALPFVLGVWLCFHAAWRGRRGERGVLPLAMVIAVMIANTSGNRLTGPITWLVLAYGLTTPRAPPGRASPEAVSGAGEEGIDLESQWTSKAVG
jgi:O-antigen ligase